MSLAEKAAFTLGSVVRAFREGVSGEKPGNAKRPDFLSAWAESERWKGGNYSATREEAQKRAVQNSWVYSAINEKAFEISNGQLHIYRVTGLDEDAQQIPNHPFEWILRKPNPFMGGAFLWQYTHWWMDMDGNGYWFTAPDASGQLAELWPIPAGRCWAVPGDKDRFVDYYEYQVNGRIEKIPAEYICHFRYPNPFDVYRGLSPLVAGMLPVDSDLAMARWNGSFFGKNNTMPSAIISLSAGPNREPINQEDISKVKAQLAEEYSATERKTVVTNAYDMAVQLLGYNAKDMDFLAGRIQTKDEIYQVLGYPPGYADKNSTEANATVGYNKFLNRIYNTMILYSEQITSQIMGRWYGDDLEARFEDIRPVNKDMELREAEAAKGDMTINERRQRFWKLPPIEGGDELPGANVPKKDTEYQNENDLDQGADEDATPKMNTDNGLPANAKSLRETDLRNWKTKAIKAIKNGSPASVKFESTAIEKETQELIQDSLEAAEMVEDIREIFSGKAIERPWRPWSAFETRLLALIQGLLQNQADELIFKLSEGDPTVLEDAVVWATMAEAMRKAIEPLLVELAELGVERVKQVLGGSAINVNWSLANGRATDWARVHAGELVTKVTDTTRKAVGEAVAQWSQTDEGLSGLIDRISAMKEDGGKPVFNRNRAEMIAVTEATNTFAAANAEAWEKAGYKKAVYLPGAHIRCRCYIQPWTMPDGTKVMVWYTARDERVCVQELTTPWGKVKGCRDLHQVVISEGEYLGKSKNEGKKGFDPNQPRVPAGNSEGGQWTKGSSGLNIKKISPYLINPVNPIRDKEKYQALVLRMKEKGWQGRPILVFESGENYEALTGSHRIYAAMEAGIDVEAEIIDISKFSEDDIDRLTSLYEDEDRAAFLLELTERGLITESQSELMSFEVQENYRNVGVSYKEESRRYQEMTQKKEVSTEQTKQYSPPSAQAKQDLDDFVGRMRTKYSNMYAEMTDSELEKLEELERTVYKG